MIIFGGLEPRWPDSLLDGRSWSLAHALVGFGCLNTLELCWWCAELGVGAVNTLMLGLLGRGHWIPPALGFDSSWGRAHCRCRSICASAWGRDWAYWGLYWRDRASSVIAGSPGACWASSYWWSWRACCRYRSNPQGPLRTRWSTRCWTLLPCRGPHWTGTGTWQWTRHWVPRVLSYG